MIRSFKSKGLAELWAKGTTRRIDSSLHKRILLRLNRIDLAATTTQLNVPGFDFHALRGFAPVRYTIHINGPWCLTFEFDDGAAFRVDLEQYH